MLNDTKLVNVMMTLRIAVIFILALPNLILAGPLKGLVEENFGEHFYGVYLDDYKLGFVIHKLAKTENEIIQEFSMNMRVTMSEEKVEEEGAKYAVSQTASRAEFDKETGLLKQMTEAYGDKFYADYNALLKDNYFKKEISTLTANYNGDFSYEVSDNNKERRQRRFLKLPSLTINDYFSEINFVHSNPKVGDVRNVDVFELDFEAGVYSGVTLHVETKNQN